MSNRRRLADISTLVVAIVAVALYLAAPAHAASVPTVSIPSGQTNIDDIGWYGVSYRYTDGRTGGEPMGWTGMFDDKTGISAEPAGIQNGKRAYLEHPIWHGGTGDTDQTYRIALPKAAAISLSFSIAMRTDAVGKSDGATFRVFVDGAKLLDQNKTDGVWSDYRFDLSSYAGQTITLVFEIDPGPREYPSFDFALWGDRRLVCNGGPQTSITPLFLPPNTPLDAKQAGWGGASPMDSAESGPVSKIAVSADPAPTGLFDGLSFDLGAGKPGLKLPFAQSAWLELVAPDGSIVSSESAEVHASVTQIAPSPEVIQRTAVYTLGGRTVTVVAEISAYHASSVLLRLTSNDPYIAAVHFGRIGPAEFERQIVVPYYGSINYAMSLGLFSNTAIDYSLSRASALDGDVAEYRPLTDGTRIPVGETVYYALSPHARAVLPTPIDGVSPYRQTMGDVVVNDYWGGDAPGLANDLQDLSTYGLIHFLTIVHNWQHGGYDQQLPSVLPANSSIGGNSGVIALTTTAKSLGEMVALHENYVDFYPNGPLYDPSKLALQPDGKPIPAWMFPGHVSYVMTPVVMRRYAKQITTAVHSELGTNASYLDVHSAITPFMHTDARAGRQGAGEFITCLNAQRDLWQLMRDVHGGPVLGEGANHWWWSGMLDGVEAQFGVGVSPSNAGEAAPLFVDFDLLKIHPRQTNHGMGYVSRWLTDESAKPTQSELEEYRMQEIAYGHSAFVGNLDLPQVWEEHNLVIPVASRYATANARSIAYEVDGVLRDTDDAVAAGTDFRRVRIVYDNGLTVWANGRPTPWTVRAGGRSFELPEYGWVAVAPGLTAYAATIGGHMATFAGTPRSVFADAHTAIVTTARSQLGPATPRALDMAQIGPRQFQIRFAFNVARPIPTGYRGFVHLVSDHMSANEGIVTQFPLGIDSDPSTWTPGRTQAGSLVNVQLPSGVPDGVFDIRVGLFRPDDGNRLELSGVDDGSRRYTVARIAVTSGGDSITITPVGPSASNSASDDHVVDFGIVATNGSIKLTRRRAGVWTLIPLPRYQAFQVDLDGSQLDSTLASHISAIAINATGATVGQPIILPKHAGRSRLEVSLPAGAIGYKLTGAQ